MSAPTFSEGFTFVAHRVSMEVKDKPSDNGGKQQSEQGVDENQKKKISFRDILTEGRQKAPTKERVNLVEKGLVKIEYEGGNKLLPKVFLDESYFQDLCHPWKDALVVKLLGKTGGYNVLNDRLTKMWKLQGQFEIMVPFLQFKTNDASDS